MYDWNENQFSKDNCYEFFLQLLPVFSDFIVFLNKLDFYLAYSQKDFSLRHDNIDFNSKYLHHFVMLNPYNEEHLFIIAQYRLEKYLPACKAYEYYAVNRKCIYFTDEEELFLNFCDDIRYLLEVIKKIYIDRHAMIYNNMNSTYSINFISGQVKNIKPNIFTNPFKVDMVFYKNTIGILSTLRKIDLTIIVARESCANKFKSIEDTDYCQLYTSPID